MRRPYQILIPLLSLFLTRVDLTDLYPVTMNVDILKVYDGDTLLVKRRSFQQKVRLSRIDAPEKGQPYISQEGNAGEYSKDCLKRLSHRTGELQIYGIDMYGRILGDVDQLSLKLIQAGCTPIYPHARFRSVSEKFLYLRELDKAKRSRLGLWARGGILQPKLYRKLSKRFNRRVSHRQ